MKISTSSPYFSLCLILISMTSIQCSACLAKTIFPIIGAAGTTALRIIAAAIILILVGRPWRKRFSIQTWKATILYGLSIGCMNLCFYTAISLLPLGVAVGLEITGPLTVALVSSRKLTDFIWIALAVTGLYILLPLRLDDTIDPAGAAYALGAATCWGLYILFGKKMGTTGGDVAAVAMGMLIGSCVVFPVGLASAGLSMFAPGILPYGILLGIFSSALPYGLEIYALKNLPTHTFGVLESLNPALASFTAFLFLQEVLTPGQWLALGCITVATIGVTICSRRT